MMVTNNVTKMFAVYNTSNETGNTTNINNTTTTNTKSDTDHTINNEDYDTDKLMTSTTIANPYEVALDKNNIKDAYEMILGLNKEEDTDNKFDDVSKVLKIARRIARGDKVPAYDEKKLMEYSKELYQMSKASAMLNRTRKPKKYKSLYDEKNKQNELERMAKAISHDTKVENVEIKNDGTVSEPEVSEVDC